MKYTLILAIGFAACIATVWPSDAGVLEDIEACRAERDDARRLACYDRANGGLVAPPTSAEKFGEGDLRAQAEREANRSDDDGLKVLVAKVTEVSKQPNGTHVITLDNGQVWRETSLEDFFRVSVGDEVRIRPAVLGTFLLADPNGRATRVRRIK